MLNEHHQTATCVDPRRAAVLAALARLTTKARLFDPRQSHRKPRQPIRVAEEMAMIDVLSARTRRGRFSCAACPMRFRPPPPTRCA